ncbi:MAG: hypothetical protein R3192_15610 [Woeseiaceae bacterium]|nr:hypothetical protein [Woeseiaceae bacterium]
MSIVAVLAVTIRALSANSRCHSRAADVAGASPAPLGRFTKNYFPGEKP